MLVGLLLVRRINDEDLSLTKHRGIISLVAVLTTVVVCLSVALWSPAGVVTNALILLVVSLCGFHVAAWYAFDRKRAWQCLDYALELVTVTSLFAAVAGIQQSAISQI